VLRGTEKGRETKGNNKFSKLSGVAGQEKNRSLEVEFVVA